MAATSLGKEGSHRWTLRRLQALPMPLAHSPPELQTPDSQEYTGNARTPPS